MIDLTRSAATLAQLVRDADADQLPDLAGLLEAAKVRVSVRLQPAAPAAVELVDATEMARILDVPTNWVMDKARSGALPSTQLGHYRRFAPGEVLEAVRSLPALHDSRLCALKKRQKNRAPTPPVSSGCPTGAAENG